MAYFFPAKGTITSSTAEQPDVHMGMKIWEGTARASSILNRARRDRIDAVVKPRGEYLALLQAVQNGTRVQPGVFSRIRLDRREMQHMQTQWQLLSLVRAPN